MKKKHSVAPPTPWQRLVQMLHYERRTVNFIFLYALVIGLIGLSLPLGITAVFNLLSNGSMYSSTYILIAVILIGVIIGGILLISQLTLVEALEQKIFAKSAVEFAYKLPRIKPQEFDGENVPELINRFFDVSTIQKGLSKLLVDFVTAGVAILFSVILLSLYHPIFIAFGVLTILVVLLVILLYFNRGFKTSIQESEHKYEVVAYLEEVSAQLEKYRNNPEASATIISRTDEITANYLKARNNHFKILKRFFASSVILRVFLLGGLLLVGSYLVVTRQMTFGQFVASEVIIVQISYAVEKLMTSFNTIFDMVTGSEKLAVITDLELKEEDLIHA